MNFLESLGVTLRLRRNEKNLPQVELAGIVDMERSTISAIENGHNNISMNSFLKLCEGLEEDPRTILDEALKRMGK